MGNCRICYQPMTEQSHATKDCAMSLATYILTEVLHQPQNEGLAPKIAEVIQEAICAAQSGTDLLWQYFDARQVYNEYDTRSVGYPTIRATQLKLRQITKESKRRKTLFFSPCQNFAAPFLTYAHSKMFTIKALRGSGRVFSNYKTHNISTRLQPLRYWKRYNSVMSNPPKQP